MVQIYRMGYIVLFVLIAFFGSLIFLRINNEFWSAGKIPFYYRKTRENEWEIYIALAASIISSDLRDTKEKTFYLRSYFQQKFKDVEEYYDFGDSLVESYKHPTDIYAIGKWISKNSRTKQEKVNALQFAVSLAMLDGSLIEKEYKKIIQLKNSLGLSAQELDRIIRMYQRQQDDQEEQERQYARSNYKPQKTIYLEILGLPEHANFQEVKKAYRKLAKLHHPDKFVNASIIQQKMAKERFVKIQEAYDYLEKKMN